MQLTSCWGGELIDPGERRRERDDGELLVVKGQSIHKNELGATVDSSEYHLKTRRTQLFVFET